MKATTLQFHIIGGKTSSDENAFIASSNIYRSSAMKKLSTACLSTAIWTLAIVAVVDAFVTTKRPSPAIPVTSLRSSSSDGDAEGLLSRRQVGELTVAGVGLGVSYLGTREKEFR